jgi:hypothetical protein
MAITTRKRKMSDAISTLVPSSERKGTLKTLPRGRRSGCMVLRRYWRYERNEV